MSVIARSELRHGFQKSVKNAFSLLHAAMELMAAHPTVALGLAEIGQEELGKSLSCLAAIALPKDGKAFKWFWGAWKDHRLKAYRAHLYELISPARFEIAGPDGQDHLGITDRAHIAIEKEVSFYVNYDSKERRFLLPAEAVNSFESYRRIFSLAYLAVTAFYLAAALDEDDAEFRHQAFADVALLICSSEVYQQDMPVVFERLAAQSDKHAALVAAVAAGRERGWQYMNNLHTGIGNEDRT